MRTGSFPLVTLCLAAAYFCAAPTFAQSSMENGRLRIQQNEERGNNNTFEVPLTACNNRSASPWALKRS